MTLTEIMNFLSATLLSIGGATVIILGLSKWFGDFLSQRLLDNYNNKHSTELEGIKVKYSKELEETKSTLEKAKSQFLRYSEKQFDLYNGLWRVLLYTKLQADELWENAIPDKIPSFSEQIKLTKIAIDDNLLLIEEDHYNKLMELLKEFEQFQFGKVRLVDFRRNEAGNEESISNLETTKQTIDLNKNTKDNYDKLIMEIGKTFRNQIKG
jgi:hypothetical protein